MGRKGRGNGLGVGVEEVKWGVVADLTTLRRWGQVKKSRAGGER